MESRLVRGACHRAKLDVHRCVDCELVGVDDVEVELLANHDIERLVIAVVLAGSAVCEVDVDLAWRVELSKSIAGQGGCEDCVDHHFGEVDDGGGNYADVCTSSCESDSCESLEMAVLCCCVTKMIMSIICVLEKQEDIR